MVSFPFLGIAALTALPVTKAVPTGLDNLARRQAITALSESQINYFTPYTLYASAAYCPSAELAVWACGVNCQAIPQFEPVAAGGDGNLVQYWYVGFDPTLDSVIVAHQGTDPAALLADLTDVNLIQEALDPTLFPGLSTDILVHSGFANEQSLTAADVLSAVQETMAKYGVNQVTIVGHSLGKFSSFLTAFNLSDQSDTQERQSPFSTPYTFLFIFRTRRSLISDTAFHEWVGNQAFANYVDAGLTNVTHVNDKKDVIAIVPPTSLGFIHPSGEVHIEDWGDWDACPGQENPSPLCIVGDVPTVLQGNIVDHLGPYNGIWIGCGVQTIIP
ncbi:lipase [Sparassis crispa]|uniref:Lipase n=1 Tax=Sparassis crispa TaxID=139825 RepID=A0A401GWS6_9APHY|nr:lipase [Sparassis crispa]GBE86677.1 lipase [Sparassis crispa]